MADQKSRNSQIPGVHLTHPDRILYPRQGITKHELALYNIRDLPHRVATLRRDPWEGYEAARRTITTKRKKELRPSA
ncbi:MAG: hypothetical protein ACREYC_25245 [Gammaproteobacteria bacterium]